MRKINRRYFIATAISTVITMAQPAYAQDNNRPITIVVPYSAGGTNDNFARLLAEGMSKELGRHIIVENKPGANGIIGASYVARARPDGTTLFLGGTGPVSLNIMLRPSLAYNFDHFDSVAMLFDGPLTITVPSSMGVNSVNELIAHAKQKNQPLLYGTMGPGSVSDLYGLLVSKTFDIPLTAVAYKNNHSAIMDLMAGRGDMNYATPIPMIQNSKELKILTLTSEQRDPTLPDIPTIAELGYPELKTSYWTGLLAPKGTPKDEIEKIASAAIKTVKTKAYQRVLTENGQIEKAGGPERLDAQLQNDRNHWGKIISENKIVIN
ncbi:MAG: tripartite tricarboxylate transporter substrate binding protein [Alcaligenaceae bacterium]|nr:tripartite tricarboxylate transporter substrate binding protein [Alcaligenaceae bacterium]